MDYSHSELEQKISYLNTVTELLFNKIRSLLNLEIKKWLINRFLLLKRQIYISNLFTQYMNIKHSENRDSSQIGLLSCVISQTSEIYSNYLLISDNPCVMSRRNHRQRHQDQTLLLFHHPLLLSNVQK